MCKGPEHCRPRPQPPDPPWAASGGHGTQKASCAPGEPEPQSAAPRGRRGQRRESLHCPDGGVGGPGRTGGGGCCWAGHTTPPHGPHPRPRGAAGRSGRGGLAHPSPGSPRLQARRAGPGRTRGLRGSPSPARYPSDQPLPGPPKPPPLPASPAFPMNVIPGSHQPAREHREHVKRTLSCTAHTLFCLLNNP